MPGFNGIGPFGGGPMTGRGLGRCNARSGQYGVRLHRNFGFGQGCGRGRGRFFGYGPAYPPAASDLQAYEQFLEEELTRIRKNG